MKLDFARHFHKDLKSLRDPKLAAQLKELIHSLQQASSLSELPQVKTLSGHPDCFRIRIRDHRLGLRILGDRLLLARFLHRKDIYRHFPG